MDSETREVLRSLLQMQLIQLQYLEGLHNSTIALFDALCERDSEIRTLYKQHRLAPVPEAPGQNIAVLLRNIDALIQQLK